MKKAKELMTKDLISVQSGSEISDQIKIFLDNDISSAPVVSPMGELLGSLTELGLIRAYLAHRLNKKSESNKVVHHKDLLDKVVVVQEDDAIIDVIKTLLKSPTKRLVVQNNMRNLTGIISPKDVLRFLAGESNNSILLRDELEATRKKLEEIKEELEDTQKVLENYLHLYEDAPTMMHSVDAKGKIIMANKKIHINLGYDPGELLEKTIFDLYSKSCHSDATQGLKHIIDNGQHTAIYTTMLTKDGKKLRVDVASSALKDKYGKFLGTISASRIIDSDSLLRALHGAFNKKKVEKQDLEDLLGSDDEE